MVHRVVISENVYTLGTSALSEDYAVKLSNLSDFFSQIIYISNSLRDTETQIKKVLHI